MKRGAGMRRLLIALAMLALLLVVVDRVGAWAAQRALADQVSQELTSRGVDSAPPEASIDRVPFLTQVAAGRYESITVHLRDVGTDELRLPTVDLTAWEVTAATSDLLNREGPVTAERLTGTATISYRSVADQVGLPDLHLSATDGRLRIELAADALGTPVQVSGEATTVVVDSAVQVLVEDLRIEQPSVPAGAEALLTDLAQLLSVTVALPPLPYGLRLESVRAESAGLVVTVAGENVRLV